MEDLKKLQFRPLWAAFKAEGPAFWMICLYILMEYIRPEGIYPWLNIFPWTRMFVILALAFHFLRDKGSLARDAYTFWILVFLATVIISCFYAYSPAIAFKGLYGDASWVVIYFAVSSVVNTERRLWMFVLLFFLGCAKMSIFCADVWVRRGFSFAAWGVAGPPGYFQNSGELSLLMCMFFAMSYAFWRDASPNLTRIRSWILLSLPVSAVMTVLASSDRGSQIALLAEVVFLAIAYGKFTWRNLAYAAIIAAIVYSVFPEQQVQRFSTAGTDQTSVARLHYWKAGLQMFERHPLTGVGLNNFPIYFHKFYGYLSVFHGREEVSHNFIIQLASEIGFLGVAVYLLMIFRTFIINAHTKKLLQQRGYPHHWIGSFATGLNCAMVAFLISAQFMAVAFYPYVWIQMAFVVAAKRAAYRLQPRSTATMQVGLPVVRGVGGVRSIS